MSSLSLVQSCLWTVTRCVLLIQQKLLTFITAHEFSSLSLVQSCLWTVTRCVPLVQQKLLTLIRAHEFTQPCSILSLNSDAMCAPSAAETSYLDQSTWVHSDLFNLVFEQWHDGCPLCSRNLLPYLYRSTWVHSALINLVFEQWHDVCP
jgi:hypothetical protein